MFQLQRHQALRREILQIFGFREDVHFYPLHDSTMYFWRLAGGISPSFVRFADQQYKLISMTDFFENGIIKGAGRLVYRSQYNTMVIVQAMDNNRFLQIFDNAKEMRAR